MLTLKESCGVMGIYSFEDLQLVRMLVSGLQSQQHRGQEAWGIGVPGRVYKKMGMVLEGYTEDVQRILRGFKGSCGIGHVRYSTKGISSLSNAHPIQVEDFSIAHNGTIPNYHEIALKIKSSGQTPSSHATDTELAAIRLRQIYGETRDWFEAFKRLGSELDGAYNFTIVTDEGELIAVRDGRGFRPLCVGWEDSQSDSSLYVIASESCVIDYINARFDRRLCFRDVEPGSVVKVSREGCECRKIFEEKRHAHCPFEYTYFANPSSYIEGINVYEARENCGRMLAKMYEEEVKGDVVIPIPDTARPAAIGFSEESGIPHREGLMKDRYRRKGSLRSFIEPSKRVTIVREMIPIKPVIEGKDVIVVDDSIVRGTTSREIVRRLKAAGAKRIQWYLTFPPIQYPCYQGIDFPAREELIVPKVSGRDCTVEEANELIKKYLRVNRLGYIDRENLSRGVGLPLSDLCTSCVTGDYSCLKNKPIFRSRREMKS
ncbi:MAG: amidophosphoribosyltransferase [Candidatus Bathyarchaeia archaeon]